MVISGGRPLTTVSPIFYYNRDSLPPDMTTVSPICYYNRDSLPSAKTTVSPNCGHIWWKAVTVVITNRGNCGLSWWKAVTVVITNRGNCGLSWWKAITIVITNRKLPVRFRRRRSRDRMVVGFQTTYAIRAYHHLYCEFESCFLMLSSNKSMYINTVYIYITKNRNLTSKN
jgi:hypothetical protein